MSYRIAPRIEWNEVHVKFPVLMNEVKTRVKPGRRGKSTPNNYASLRNLAPLHWNFIEDMPSRPFPEGKCLELTHSVPNSDHAYRLPFDRMFAWFGSVLTCDSTLNSDWLIRTF